MSKVIFVLSSLLLLCGLGVNAGCTEQSTTTSTEKSTTKITTEASSTTAETTEDAEDFPMLGGFTELTEADIKELHPKLAYSLIQLGKQNDEFDYFLNRILDGKHQVVAGTHYVINLELVNEKKETKTCEADIIEQLWENFFSVSMHCEKEYSIKIKLTDELKNPTKN